MTFPGFGHTLPVAAEAILWVELAAAVLVGVAIIVYKSQHRIFRIEIRNALSKITKISPDPCRTLPNKIIGIVLTHLRAVSGKDTLPFFALNLLLLLAVCFLLAFPIFELFCFQMTGSHKVIQNIVVFHIPATTFLLIV